MGSTETKQHYQFQLTAKGPDGLDYVATFFQEMAGPADPERLLADVRKQNPSFTDLKITSFAAISPDRYSFLVRQICDSGEWGFSLI